MRARLGLLIVVSLPFPGTQCWGQGKKKPESSRVKFVKEFIRELGAIEDIRFKGEEEQKKDPGAAGSNIIHSGTLFKLELGSQVRMLSSMHFNEPFDTLVPNITDFYKEKIKIWNRMIEIGREFMGGSRPGVDYQKLGAEMPELRAKMEYVDQSILEATPLVFAMLIDMKEDSMHHANHLIITKTERAELIDQINMAFGSKLDEKEPGYTVGAARVLKDYLLKDYKSSDEEWE